MVTTLQLEAAINALKTFSNQRRGAADLIRNEASHEQQVRALKELLHIEKARDYLIGRPFADNWGNLWSQPARRHSTKIQQILNWLPVLAECYTDNLKLHNRLSAQIESALLLGHNSEASDLLKEHQAKLGYSIWGLNWLVYLAGEIDGLKGPKKLVDIISKTTVGNKAGEILATYFSLLNDPTIPDAHACEAVRSRIISNGNIAPFLNLAVLDSVDYNWTVSSILSFFDFIPLVDRFILFKRVVAHAVSSKNDDAPKCLRTFEQIEAFAPTKDGRYLVECCAETSSIARDELDAQMLRIWDAYIDSNYTLCKTLAEDMLKTMPTIFFGHDLLVKSYIYLGIRPEELKGSTSSSPFITLQKLLYDIYTRRDNTEPSLASLLRLSTRLNINRLRFAIRGFVKSHSIADVSESFDVMVAYSHGVHGPRNLELLRPSSHRLYLDRLEKAHPNSLAISFLRSANLCPENLHVSHPTVDDQRLTFFSGIFAARLNNGSVAKANLTRFLRGQREGSVSLLSPFAVEEARRVLLKVLYQIGDVIGLLDLAVEVLADRYHNVRRLDFKRSIELCDQSGNIAFSHIGYPILASITMTESHDVSFALRRYLFAQNGKLPTDLIPLNIATTHKALLFLKVCTMDVMESLDGLEAVKDLEEERLKLLQWLAEYSPKDARTVETELLRITQQAQLREAIDNVDSCRLVLNIPSLREAEAERFEKLYFGYLAQKRLLGEATDKLLKYGEEATTRHLTPTYLSFDGNAPEQLVSAFKSAFEGVRDQFVHNHHFGINACLSIRIRHGFAVDQICRPLTETKLAYNSHASNSSSIVEYWKSVLGEDVDADALEALLNVFEELTLEARNLAREVKDEWIQCTPSQAAVRSGMFDYNFTSNEIEVLRKKEIFQDPSIEFFLDLIFDALIARTHACLSSVRRRIEKEMRPRLLKIVQEAQTSINSIDSIPKHALQAVHPHLVKCYQEIEVTATIMCRWFKESPTSMMRDADPTLASRTAVGMAVMLNPIRADQITTAEGTSECKIKGRFFTSIVHIAHFLIDNAIRYCRLPPESQCIRVNIRTTLHKLIFTVSNKCPNNEMALECAETVQSKAEQLSTSPDWAKIAGEGDSGFAKIWSTITHEFKGGPPHVTCTAVNSVLEISVSCEAHNIIAS